MKLRAKDLKRFVPGLLTSALVMATTAILLFLSVNDNEAPHAVIDSSAEIVDVGEPILFDGRESHDPDGDDITYHWTINQTMFNMEPFFYYSFPAPGNFTVELMVEDTDGSTDTETLVIDVR
jgi:hypothetical protein